MLDSGLPRAAMHGTRKLQKTVDAFCKAEHANYQFNLKLKMLSHKYWRRLVLKELGGQPAIERWHAARARCILRAAELLKKGHQARPISKWRKTPARMAEELAQKAHAEKCAKASAHPRIFRDPFKTDSDGKFRLPPLPRIKIQRDPDASWTTPFDITAYNYNAVPVLRPSRYEMPILVWPEEFEAAELWDYERWLRERRVTQEIEARDAPSLVIPHKTHGVADAGPNDKERPLGLGPGSAPVVWQAQTTSSSGMTKLRRLFLRPQNHKENPGLRPVNSELSPASA